MSAPSRIPFDREYAAWLYTEKGWSSLAIADAYGMPAQTVRESLRRSGVKIRPRGRKHYPDPDQFAREIRAWHARHGYSPNTSDWTAAHPDGPAYQTVVNRLRRKSWADVLKSLGLPPN